VHKTPGITRTGDLCVVDLLKADGEIGGATAWHVGSGAPVVISAKATIVATGGLTRLYRRNSASTNMGGDGYALCLRAGAPLIDMEFVQFFPIGHLAPRLIGMDPIMWDPFRYKLGGRLLNKDMQEFTDRYGVPETGRYVITRDVGTYAILKEVEAGRGSPHGGAYLSFQHVPAEKLREAFGPVIDRLANNGIDLTKMPVEVAPIAHYHMGGVAADVTMQTELPGLLVAGEAVGGANGANRLSGNAITEAFTFGRRAGLRASALAAKTAMPLITEIGKGGRSDLSGFEINAAMEIARLQQVVNEHVGPLRTHAGLERALAHVNQLKAACTELPAPKPGLHPEWIDLHDLRNMRLVAECIARAALAREESRGAHQREDFPETSSRWEKHQKIRLASDGVRLEG